MQYDLYVVTDETLSGGLSHSRIAELAVEGGADIIQLREKKKTDLELYEIGRGDQGDHREKRGLFHHQ